ncbi:Cyclic nucleotide-gated potassium channel [Posidoniimonas polymericola]|uniref:Cyclic nucleotide-gated potassium channel n=1 Tax=Posidoniimonas polymericola TaxID=2528002 RepID=A0A5C5YQK7_9BACT|nr:transporter substrate-binding domain-containing protein [Posidoniimonas polymericola]TWT77242.1 Cyclic nucleotide-gated potassium channel [Posidoniimonas polymericola]
MPSPSLAAVPLRFFPPALLAVLSVALAWPATGYSQQDATEAPASETIVIAARETPPFTMKGPDGQWSGICIDLLREVQADLQGATDNEVSLEFRELGLNELLAAVEQGEVDLGVGAITVNYERERRMDFSHPFHSSGLGIAIGSQEQDDSWLGVARAVLSPTFVKVVAGLFAALLVSAVAVYFFERRGNPEQFGGGAVRGIGSGMWWAAVTLTTVGYGDKAPKTLPGRLIGLVWMFAGLFIIASFTASVTSALTINQLKAGITGPGDLVNARVATVEGSTADAYLRARGVGASLHGTAADALASLRSGEVDAVVYDAPILRYQVAQQSGGGLAALPVIFAPQEYAFPLPNESKLREPINRTLLRVTGQPAWRQSLEKYLGERFDEL